MSLNIEAKRFIYSYFVVGVILCFGVRYFFGLADEEVTSINKAIYELGFVVFFVFCVLSGGLKSVLDKSFVKPLFYVFVLLIILLAKYLLVEPRNNEFFWTPFLMEMKPLYYFVMALVFAASIKDGWFEYYTKGVIFLAVLMIIGSLLKFVINGGEDVRASVIEEANYDGLLLALGILSIELSKPKRYYLSHAIILLATLMTLSRTGLAASLILYAVIMFKKGKIITLAVAVSLLLPIAALLLQGRFEGVESVDELDRLRMWLSFYQTVEEANISEMVFGLFPGFPIRYQDFYIQYFIESQSEGQWKIYGLHPFNFHGMNIRLVLTWGGLGVLYIAGILFGLIKRSGWYFGALVFYVLVQGLSMGAVYLTTVAVPLYMFMIFLWRHECRS